MFGLSLSLGRNEKVPHSKQKWSCLGLELSHIGAGICESVCVCVCVCVCAQTQAEVVMFSSQE